MPGVYALRKLQLGKETTDYGTAVAATVRLRMEGAWEDLSTFVFPPENVGYLSGKDRQVKLDSYAHLAMTGDASFEELPYILEAGVSIVTPTTDSGSGYIYTYEFAETAQNSIRTFTMEAGDDQAEEESAYCHVQNFTLSGVAREAWQVAADWYGRAIVDTDSFTPSTDVSTLDAESMLFQMSKLYIDVTTDTIGTTQKSNTFLDAELSVKTGYLPVWTGEGQLYFSFLKQTRPEVILKITFEHDGTSVAEKQAWRAKTTRLIRVRITGTALTSAGTYTTKNVDIDLAGKWTKFDALGERDGNDICTGTFQARYNSTADLFARITVVNEQATLT